MTVIEKLVAVFTIGIAILFPMCLIAFWSTVLYLLYLLIEKI